MRAAALPSIDRLTANDAAGRSLAREADFRGSGARRRAPQQGSLRVDRPRDNLRIDESRKGHSRNRSSGLFKPQVKEPEREEEDIRGSHPRSRFSDGVSTFATRNEMRA